MPEEIVAFRAVQADVTHDHVELVGYQSPHIEKEPIMLSIERTLQRISLGEQFFMKGKDGQEITLVAGTCPECGHEPYLRTVADEGDEQLLMTLPPR